MKTLIQTTEVYRVDSEREVDQLLNDAESRGDLTKKIVETKQRKAKGEIIDEAFKVTITLGKTSDFWVTEREDNDEE